jgi:heat shock protein HtpX
MPMPRVYLIDEAQPNAFATGRNPDHAAVAATTGILQLLSARELRGVMAHELSHVKHRDILHLDDLRHRGRRDFLAGPVRHAVRRLAIRTASAPTRSSPSSSCLAPIAAMLIQMAISRAREFEADRGGAEISGDPNALADALAKIDAYARGIPMHTAEAHPETAQMMIMNPLSGGGLRGLFSTHPATEERVAKLRAMPQRR